MKRNGKAGQEEPLHETKIKHVWEVGVRNTGHARQKYAIGVCFGEEHEV